MTQVEKNYNNKKLQYVLPHTLSYVDIITEKLYTPVMIVVSRATHHHVATVVHPNRAIAPWIFSHAHCLTDTVAVGNNKHIEWVMVISNFLK